MNPFDEQRTRNSHREISRIMLAAAMMTGSAYHDPFYQPVIPQSHPPTNTPEYHQSLADKAQAKRDRKAKAKQKQL